MKASVLVAMSGGVDSSVAALLLLGKGYKVMGATMKIWDEAREVSFPSPRICCSLSAVEDAMAVCGQLKVPYHLLEYHEHFRTEVVEDFCREYRHGRTPNPCVLCNSRLKFDHFLKEADSLGCGFMATGHYARVEQDCRTGKFLLKRGKDTRKDQSYFLYGVTQEVLSRLLLPVGDYTKEHIRKLAEDYGLPVARKKESQEICFIPDHDYASFLMRRFPEAHEKGDILNMSGKVLGTHPGYMHYTIGQRRGLGVSHPVPLYVLEIHPSENVIVVGRKEDLLNRHAVVSGINWISGRPPCLSDKISAKIRYRHAGAEVRLDPADDPHAFRVTFNEPQEAITPGQSMVFYEGEVVLGGGIIEKAE
ncbi:MAG: tRNA 2-thiouridine(34) synthase MnmA [Nitrospirae bacterium CG08_land_8_20_14_0_20_52_24]|nr:MAG: tRNA 2-thiouridine(34) synthase MnmA [Nitrospirae bacterium CG2_30_53_67]PIS37306.1 MAG: tRNA 2-thiouridine(34) synthase MnmA [Nitrospirae bacterium CG08_land_8_20_14_0_20_52_24]PIW85164.1 MAG: tRNA 2-thiouridine(34) synthase MnmA [Nitrospirae bacterium CG_4_8_14_3_um_filter_50_41]PIX85403.1 MAG: tRNA 2-thiouridine(34) synthase MnmA [Nitrospirae bacterium CG_4_10_14_3_um_filter_53_41]